ncbi:MAG: heat shock protein GrpE [Frankiales bacterium]|nr:heat shock protein GrpE [Frankiales bacterium]
MTGAAAHGRQPEAQEEPQSEEQRQLAELEDRWRRCMADLDNLRKRYARELEREREAERARATAAWLPVLDNLELALAHGAADPESLLDGLRAVRDQGVAVVELQGYPRDDEVGVPFDPARHDVVEVREAPELPSGVVVQVVRPGYGSPTRQLRPAAVAVNKTG